MIAWNPPILATLATAMLAVGAPGCSDDSEPLDPSEFACGDQRCARGADYCVRNGSDVAGEPDTYLCQELPQACVTDPQCACLEGLEAPEFNLQFCLDAGGCEAIDGGFQLTCPGG